MAKRKQSEAAQWQFSEDWMRELIASQEWMGPMRQQLPIVLEAVPGAMKDFDAFFKTLQSIADLAAKSCTSPNPDSSSIEKIVANLFAMLSPALVSQSLLWTVVNKLAECSDGTTITAEQVRACAVGAALLGFYSGAITGRMPPELASRVVTSELNKVRDEVQERLLDSLANLRRGLIENDITHDPDAIKAALDRYDVELAEGKSKKEARAAVGRELQIPDSTLRYHLRKRKSLLTRSA